MRKTDLSTLKILCYTAILGGAMPVLANGVQVYGVIDVGILKPIGSKTTQMGQSAPSRIGFRGTEDISGGNKVNFNLEHRFYPDTGANFNPNKFWHARSTIGLQGGWGKLDLGRDVTPATWNILLADKFTFDGVAANTNITGMGLTMLRFDNMIQYATPNINGLKAHIAYAFREKELQKNGFSSRIEYKIGNTKLDLATERTLLNNRLHAINLSHDFGKNSLNLFLGNGKPANGKTRKSWLLGYSRTFGQYKITTTYGKLKTDDEMPQISQFGVGMRYIVSSRTSFYSTFAYDRKKQHHKSGVDLGITHSF